MNKKTLVLGASPNPSRFSNKAVLRLQKHHHDVVPVGIKKGSINGLEIQTELTHYNDIHTVTLYLNPQRQKAYYDYIVALHPERLIFNPGTENKELADIARKNNITVVEMCTLVLLSTRKY